MDKGGQICGNRRKLDYGWGANKTVLRCTVMILYSKNYIMLLTNVTPNKFNKNTDAMGSGARAIGPLALAVA